MPLALVRPDDWNFPLLLHVLGAMLLVGSLVLVATALLMGWRSSEGGELASTLGRLGFRSLLLAALPSWVLMRFAGEWIASEEDVPDEADWLGVGYITGDLGLPVLLVATLLAGLGLRRARRGGAGPGVLAGIAGILSSLLLVAYVIAMWAMTTKPGT